MIESTVWRVMNWLIAQWVLSIWNPDLMNFVTSPTRKRSLKNFYRAKGIVLHDRALNGERFFHDRLPPLPPAQGQAPAVAAGG